MFNTEFGDGQLLIDEPAFNRRWDSVVNSVRKEYQSDKQSYPWVVAFSGGKDSTVVLHLVFEALLSIPPSQRTREIHVLSNDTGVESPFVMQHLDSITPQIDEAAISMGLPIRTVRTNPNLNETFWTLLIGKGYPSPNQKMRWCTDRLKIKPTSSYIKSTISAAGSAIIVLGVRKNESSARNQVLAKYVTEAGTQLSPHESLSGAFVFRPIIDMTVDEVWEALGTLNPPWGGSHRNLIKLYRDSEGGECPVVLSADEAPGCGTPNSRFGCWTCTVVEKDKSLQGFVDQGIGNYQPLIDFRLWLKEIRNDPKRRQLRRRNGQTTFMESGKHVQGPFTITARQEILDKIKKIENLLKIRIITSNEIDTIYKFWLEDVTAEQERVKNERL